MENYYLTKIWKAYGDLNHVLNEYEGGIMNEVKFRANQVTDSLASLYLWLLFFLFC